MKIAVVGAGAAGLVSAWLLEQQHEVTLFEGQERLGGHADTVEVDYKGETVLVESGFEFFWDDSFPRFQRLLGILGVETRKIPVTMALYRPGVRHVRVFPPIRDGKWAWEALAPRTLHDLLHFLYVLRRATGIIDRSDTDETIADFLSRTALSRKATDAFIYPLLQAGWGVPLATFRTFSAFGALSYYSAILRRGLAIPYINGIDGGMRAYVAALAKCLPRTRILTSARVTGIERRPHGHLLRRAGADPEPFDHVVVATGAADGVALLAGTGLAPPLFQALGSIKHFKTVIAVHGDRRLMPARRDRWSLVNIRHVGDNGLVTVWRDARAGRPVFRSWMAEGEPMPEPLYRAATYAHPLIDPEHFRTQDRIEAHQGTDSLWLAGVYAKGTDSHESAVLSAIRIGRRLSPDAPRLRAIQASPP